MLVFIAFDFMKLVEDFKNYFFAFEVENQDSKLIHFIS